ncbi:MAG: TonB-dependent receptor [Pyrinomonadaceae bacterium]
MKSEVRSQKSEVKTNGVAALVVGRERRAPFIFTLLPFVFCLLTSNVWAQSATATLSGTVVDERGAVVVGAVVTVSNAATGLQRQVETNGEGQFTFPLLPPSAYTVRVERDGFAPVEVRDAVLSVNDHLAYRVRLRVGAVGAYVLVEDVLTVEESPSVSTVVNRRFVENLPLNGRSFQTLFELAPGAVLTRTSFNEQGQFSVNGQRANANYFTVDGVSANFGVSAGGAPGQAAAGSLPALSALGGTNSLVSIEAVEEFRIQTSTYAPEFGRLPGAQVSVVTRTGTNGLRGSAFYYFRHDALDAADWFANSRGLRKPELRQSDFGGSAGGPVVRDRLFFFASYEGLRLTQPQVVITEVPPPALRAEAPAGLRPFLAAFPLPNERDLGTGLSEFAASYTDAARLDAASLRLDAHLNRSLFVFGRYNRAPSEALQRGRGFVFGRSGQSLNTLSRTSSGAETLTLGATHAASTRLSADVRFNLSRARGRTLFTQDDFGGALPLAPALYAPAGTPPEDTRFLLLIAGGVNTSLGVGPNADNRQRQTNAVGTLSLVAGSHQFKLGADYRRLTPVYAPPRYSLSAIYGSSTGFDTQSAVIDVRAGRALLTVTSETAPRLPLFQDFSAFAQDTWRVTPRLTLTYGVRWELNPPPSERTGREPQLATYTDDFTAVALAPRGTPLWQTSYADFAPRAGAALRLSELTTLRGGVGFYYDTGGGQAAQVFGSLHPYTSVKTVSPGVLPLTPEQAAPAAPSAVPPFNTLYSFDPHLKTPYSVQFNLTAERALGPLQSLSAAYVGAAGRRLLRQGTQPGTVNFRDTRVVSNTARSDYHAMQLQFRRASRGRLHALASYTWSHAIDNASDDSSVNASVRQLNRAPERSSSSFDVRHAASAALSYDFPRRTRGWASRLGGWSADAVFHARTATPFSVYDGRSLPTGDAVELIYPTVRTLGLIFLDDPTVAGGRRVNREVFNIPGPGRTLGRNGLRGFRMWQLDAALRRSFRLTERAALQLRAEVFNVFNHPNFGNPVGDLQSGLFGQSIQMLGPSLGAGGVNGGLSPVYQVGGPRSVQLALKLHF